MISAVDNNMTALLGLALDAANMRQQAIAQNIANINTPGYVRASVSFERRLVEMADVSQRGAPPSLLGLAHFRPFIEYDETPEAIQIDRELTEMSETVLHHQALLKVLNRQFELLGMAINEGKR